MAVVGDRADVAVNIRIKVATALPMVNAARNDMPQMRDHACADEELSLRVVVDAPRVTEAVRDHLEAILNRVITPNATVDLCAFAVELNLFGVHLSWFVNTTVSFWLPDNRWREQALTTV